MSEPKYVIVKDSPDLLVIRDVGPWDKHPTVTNAVEIVVQQLADRLNGRRLQYYDSEDERDEIIVEHGRFAGFKNLSKERKNQ